MVPKSYEKTHGDFSVSGGGRPFEMTPREPIQKTTEERQKHVAIDLEALNGQDGDKRVPKNFAPKRGRTLGSFVDPQEDDRDLDDAFDIE